MLPQSVYSSIHYHSQAMHHIRPAISDSVAARLAASLVQFRLDKLTLCCMGHKQLSINCIKFLIPYCHLSPVLLVSSFTN